MEIVKLSGSYFEIGEQWGKAFGGDINSFLDMELGGLAQFYQLTQEEVIGLASKFLNAAKAYDPDFIKVLEGFSKGANVPFEKLFAARCLLELTFFIQKIPAMCTSFAVTGNATKDGQTIIGQNIDTHPGTPMRILNITWPNGVQQLSLSVGGLWEYSLSSHSSSVPFGITNMITVTYRENQNINKPPLSMVMNKATRQKRMGAALAVFVQAKKDLASFILASSAGNMAGFECVADDVEVIFPERNTLVKANHYITDRFKPGEFFTNYVSDSFLRHARLQQLVEDNYGQLTAPMMMNFLADHTEHPKSICSHVDPDSELPPSLTLASVIMVPHEKTMYVAFGNPCETRYQKFFME